MPVEAQSNKRHAYANRVVGRALHQKIVSSSTLVIGAGGIGCELLKNMVCAGFGRITVIDLDTIDTSNLNRQFLFQKRHVKRPKAIVARETALTFNPHVDIKALHANIKDPQFDVDFFSQFNLVLNALDNLDARRHVNRMCLAAGVPLIESGTAGYKGQVQPIKKDLVECYDCQPKPVAKSFPVCTIRSTPSTPIHCIVWAKSYLFPQLFGPEDENEGAELDKAAQDGESAKEIDNLRLEAATMKDIRASLTSADAVKAVFDKVFKDDIERLLSMEDMWKHRKKPVPLSYDEMAAGVQANGTTYVPNGQVRLKDQRELSLPDSFALFGESVKALGLRLQTDLTPLSWDKDDDDALDFATAAANIRATVFGIPSKTRFEVKEMAGNIIPAIATTNSAVSALLVFQAMKILRAGTGSWADASRPWYGKTPEHIIIPGNLEPPNPHCSVCRVVYTSLYVSPSCTVGRFIESMKEQLPFESEITMQDGGRLLLDPDYDDNLEKSFGELDLVPGKLVTITDEDSVYVPIVFILFSPKLDSEDLVFKLPSTIPKRPPPPVETPAPAEMGVITSRKRALSDIEVEENSSKRAKPNGIIVVDDDEEGAGEQGPITLD